MERKAFLVFPPKKALPSQTSTITGGSYGLYVVIDDRPSLFIAYDIAEVAERNQTAGKITECSVKDVTVLSHKIEEQK